MYIPKQYLFIYYYEFLLGTSYQRVTKKHEDISILNVIYHFHTTSQVLNAFIGRLVKRNTKVLF